MVAKPKQVLLRDTGGGEQIFDLPLPEAIAGQVAMGDLVEVKPKPAAKKPPAKKAPAKKPPAKKG